MYYPIDESTARIAHNMNSFFRFKEGQATEEYKASVDKAAALANEQKSKVDPIFHAKIDGLLNTYARQLAAWYNRHFSIESRYPSVMVAGPARFDNRKKDKQNAARTTHWKAYDKIKGLLRHIEAVGTGGISSDDPDCIEKLKTKCAELEKLHAFMKNANAYYAKHKTLTGCPGMSVGFAEKIQAGMARDWRSNPRPFEAYQLTNNLANIKRVKQRIAELERRAETPLQGWTFEGGEVVANASDNRLQIFFESKPDESLRGQLKKRGFKWSLRAEAWQRQLTDNAIYAAKEILKTA